MCIQLYVIGDGSQQVAKAVDTLRQTADVEVVGRAAALSDLQTSDPQTAAQYLLIGAESLMNASDDQLTQLSAVFPRSHVFVVSDIPMERRTAEPEPHSSGDGEGDDVFVAMRDAGTSGVLIHREFVPDLVPWLNAYARKRPVPVDDSPLTQRENEVLALLGRGSYVDSIARTLGLSVHTVRGYVKSILAKLDSHTQLEAVAKAKSRGWLPED